MEQPKQLASATDSTSLPESKGDAPVDSQPIKVIKSPEDEQDEIDSEPEPTSPTDDTKTGWKPRGRPSKPTSPPPRPGQYGPPRPGQYGSSRPSNYTGSETTR